MALEQLVEGATEPVQETLISNNQPVDLTNVRSVALDLLDVSGKEVQFAGAVTWAADLTGYVNFSPSATDLTAALSPYSARWKVVDATGVIIFFPRGARVQWIVSK